MRKKLNVPAPTVSVVASTPEVSVKTRHLIEAIREPFTAFAEGFSQLRVSREELAPRFVKAFEAWAKETEGSFVAFARLLDADIPEDREGYRAHPSYQAADYLRRLSVSAEREPVPEEDRPVPAYTALARLVATVLPIIDQNGQIWSSFVREMRWTEQQGERLRAAGTKAGAIKLAPTVKHRFAHLFDKAA